MQGLVAQNSQGPSVPTTPPAAILAHLVQADETIDGNQADEAGKLAATCGIALKEEGHNLLVAVACCSEHPRNTLRQLQYKLVGAQKEVGPTARLGVKEELLPQR